MREEAIDVFADASYQGVAKRGETQGIMAIGHMAELGQGRTKAYKGLETDMYGVEFDQNELGSFMSRDSRAQRAPRAPRRKF